MRVAVLTSGGDAPGMNACVRAVVRSALTRAWQALGVNFGYNGLVEDDTQPMSHDSVSNIIHRGGTVIGAGRCPEFETKEGLEKGAQTLRKHEVDALIAVGGDGTFRGLRELGEIWDGICIGIPGTVDNDATGSDFSIGFDTAVNTALEAVDRIRDTAEAFERCFIVEVMGRACGAIALAVALSGGAEEVCVPETPTNFEALAQRLKAGRAAGRGSTIIICAEGDEFGGAGPLKQQLERLVDLQFRVTVLGHIQRGGSPTARDRILGSRLGVRAIELVQKRHGGVIVGEIDGDITTTPLEQVYEPREADVSDFYLVDQLRR